MTVRQFNDERVCVKRIIYTASSFARQNLIYLQEIGKSEYLEPYKSSRGKLPSFLFCLVKSGSGQLVYHDMTYELSTGDCIFVNCIYDYTISSNNDLWKLDWIHFDGTTMRSIYDKFIERCGGPAFTSTDANLLEKQHDKIFCIAVEKNYVQDMMLMSSISELLALVMEQCWNGSTGVKVGISENKWIPVKTYIDEKYCDLITLEDLSTKFAVNKFYLTRKFKEEYGFTINEYITNLRITTAKELLRFTDKNMTEIATQIGYNDSAYFTRVFSREVGISPLKFKKMWISNNK